MKAYMIVTNDEYEFQVAHDIWGKKAVAEYLGISMDCLDSCLVRGWGKKHKYKAVYDEEATIIFREQQKKKMDKHWKEYRRKYAKQRREKEGVKHGKTDTDK